MVWQMVRPLIQGWVIFVIALLLAGVHDTCTRGSVPPG